MGDDGHGNEVDMLDAEIVRLRARVEELERDDAICGWPQAVALAKAIQEMRTGVFQVFQAELVNLLYAALASADPVRELTKLSHRLKDSQEQNDANTR